MSEHTEPRLPNPRVGKHPPLMEHSFAALGWLQRAAQAVGSPRFPETLDRVAFYLDKTARHAHTPGERAVLAGLWAAVSNLADANAQARTLLGHGCEDMVVAEAAELVERIENPDNPFHRNP